MVSTIDAFTSTESVEDLDTFSAKQFNSKNSKSNDMCEQIQMIKNYYATLDGSPDATKRFPSAFRETFHRNAVIEYPGGKLSYEGTFAVLQRVVNQGGYADLEDIFDNGDGNVTITVNAHIPEGPKDDVTRRILSFKDGKISRFRAVDPDSEQFGATINQFMTISAKDVAEKYTAMIACFDGSPDAYVKAEPIIKEIFDKNLVIYHGNGQIMDFDSFKLWAETYSNERNFAVLEEIQTGENVLRVTVRNIVGGVDQGPVEQLGVIRNGRIVHWSAAPANDTGFERLISSVSAQLTEKHATL